MFKTTLSKFSIDRSNNNVPDYRDLCQPVRGWMSQFKKSPNFTPSKPSSIPLAEIVNRWNINDGVYILPHSSDYKLIFIIPYQKHWVPIENQSFQRINPVNHFYASAIAPRLPTGYEPLTDCFKPLHRSQSLIRGDIEILRSLENQLGL